MKHYSNEDITPEAFHRHVYANKARWVSYYHQAKLVRDTLEAGRVLLVGVGDNVVTNYLRSFFEVKTVDIIKELKPDYVASVENLSELPDESFDISLCAEVLEHLPFEKLHTCLSELRRVSKSRLIVSLPYWGYTFSLRLRLPVLGVRTMKFKISGLKKQQPGGQHFWEIGKRGYPLRRVLAGFKKAGLQTERSFWDIDDPYHYYFVLKK